MKKSISSSASKATFKAAVGTMPTCLFTLHPSVITIEAVIQGRLRSDQDRSRSSSTGPIFVDRCYQESLAYAAKQLAARGLESGAKRRVNKINYHAIFSEDWKIEVAVKFVLGVRGRSQQPDLDNLWRPLQNALAIPPPKLKVPAKRGSSLYTAFASDRQVTRYSVSMMPYIAATPEGDLTLVSITAHAAPGLALCRPE